MLLAENLDQLLRLLNSITTQRYDLKNYGYYLIFVNEYCCDMMLQA
jgi:hypothetical protein